MGIALREIFARFGVLFDTKDLNLGAQSTEEVVDKIKDLGRQLTAPALVGGAVMFSRHMAEVGQALGDQARQWRMSAAQMREWQYVAEASGLQVEEMNSALDSLSRSARAATEGDYDLAYTFRRIGVDVRDGNRELKSTGVLMDEVGQRLAQIERPRLRARIANQLLGESARFIVPLFEDGGRAIHGMQEEIRGLIGGDIEEFTAQSRRARMEGARSRLAFEAMSNSLALVLMPTVTRVTSYVGMGVAWFKKWTDQSYILQSTVQVASVVIAASMLKAGLAAAAAFGPTALAMAPYVAALGFIILLVDDLNALFSGGKSLIGEWIDSMYGVGASADAVRVVKEVWEEVVEIVTRAIGAVTDFLGLTPETAVGRLNPTAARETFNRQDRERLARQGMTQDSPFSLPRRMTPEEARARDATVGEAARNVLGDLQRQFSGVLQFARGQGQGVSTRGPSAAPGAPTEVRINSPVGQIVVQPSAGMDEERLASLVHDRFQARQTDNLRAARRALVSRVPGTQG